MYYYSRWQRMFKSQEQLEKLLALEIKEGGHSAMICHDLLRQSLDLPWFIDLNVWETKHKIQWLIISCFHSNISNNIFETSSIFGQNHFFILQTADTAPFHRFSRTESVSGAETNGRNCSGSTSTIPIGGS